MAEEIDQPTKKTTGAKDPHEEMMKAFAKFREVAQNYATGVGVKHIRIAGDILGDHKIEFSSY